MTEKGLLIVISAPSGCGKSTVVKKLMEKRENVRFSVSATTRHPREGEQDGIDYFFVDGDKFEKMVENGEFLEHATYVNNRYGTPRAAVERQRRQGTDVLLDIDVQGAFQIREKCPDAVLIFLLPPSFEALKERLVLRGKDTEEVIRHRLEVAQNECAASERFDYVLVNDDIERTVSEFSAIIDNIKNNLAEVH